MKKVRKTIKNKLIYAFAVLLLLPTLVLGITAYKTAERKVNEQIVRSAKENIELMDKFITRTIEPAIKEAEYLAATLERTSGENQAQMLRSIKTFQSLHPEMLHTFVGLKNGQMLVTPFDLPDGYDPRTSIWYKQAMNSPGKVFITEPYVDTGTKDIVVTISVALQQGGGVVGLDVNLKALSDNIKQIKIGREGYAFILDQAKKVVSHPVHKAGEKADFAGVEPIFASHSGDFEYEVEGQESHVFFTTNQLTGWKLAGVISVDEAKSEASPIFVVMLIVLIAALLYGILRSYFVIRSIMVPLRSIKEIAHRISEGDLRERIQVHTNDEFGELGESFNYMADSLSAMIREAHEKSEQLAASSQQLNASADQTNQATEQITSVMQEVAAGSERQVEGIEKTARTINEMSVNAREMASRVQAVNAVALQANDMSIKGNQVIQQVVGQMQSIDATVRGLAGMVQGLSQRSQEIGKIIEVITTLSNQTNLLALNAAIEAARAGEHGRGFAVVADEVRKLAEQSTESAGKIASLIHSIQQETAAAVQSMTTGTQEVEHGMRVVDEAGQLFAQIQKSVAESATEFQKVLAAVEEVANGTKEVAATVEMMSRIIDANSGDIQTVFAATEEQLAFMQEISASSTSLAKMADELHGLVRKFIL